MKRWTWRALVFLLIGAVINVAVAWGCAIWAPLRAVWKPITWQDTLAGFPAFEVPQAWRENSEAEPALSIWVDQIDGFGVRNRLASANAEARFPPKEISAAEKAVHVKRSGWPFQSMCCAVVEDTKHHQNPGRSPSVGEWRGGMPVPHWLHANTTDRFAEGPFNRAISLIPIPTGFAANSLFWGIVCYAPFVAAGIVSRYVRSRRDLCPRCSYPTGPSTICTECGKPVKPRTAVTA